MGIDISVYAGGLALLAFVMAFYGLAARERKTPFIISTVYSTIFLVLLSVIFDLLGRFSRPSYVNISEILYLFAKGTLIFSVFYVAFRVFNIYIMHANFRDDQLWNFPPIKQIRNRWKSRKIQKYEHVPVPISERLVKDIIQSKIVPKEQLEKAIARNYPESGMKLSISAVCVTPDWSSADRATLSLISSFLKNDCLVQYTACARHPIELMLLLKSTWGKSDSEVVEKNWEDVSSNIVVVDAYTPHFGFTDTIHLKWSRRIKDELCIHYIVSHPSYVGMHTSAAEAFNIHKKSQGGGGKTEKPRKPTLVIYEGPSALISLESVEQYRIFIRHLLPSEKLWGGMFTYLIESAIDESEVDLIRSYADAFMKTGADSYTRADAHA